MNNMDKVYINVWITDSQIDDYFFNRTFVKVLILLWHDEQIVSFIHSSHTQYT